MTIGTPAASAGLALASYERPVGVNPPLDYPAYRSTARRAPRQPPQVMRQGLTEVTGPLLGRERVNAWRAQHIHFSLFGRAFTQRLVTQMFFPGDPLFAQDPIFNSAPEAARERMISRFRLDLTEPDWALAYEWDIVLRGRGAARFEAGERA
jgi:hypothetical protein